ncbi:hypothetical protein ACIQWN_38925 [Streptomyces vinaceus]|uniref:hypothetical protein n=1 Tax=Streptomyces vinaceus TaxID=1960 RepID=UPI00382F525B
MNAPEHQTAGIQVDVPVRQADLGRDGSASTIGMARWLEDARIRLRLRRFERLVGEGRFGPFQILLVGQRLSRLAPAGPAGTRVQVHTGVRLGSGPLQLPDELIADLDEMRLPETEVAERSAATRVPAARLHR